MKTHSPLHVVELGRDPRLLGDSASAEPLRSRCQWAEELRRRRPGSRYSLLVSARDGTELGAVSGIDRLSVGSTWLPRPLALQKALDRLHARDAIDVVLASSVFADAWAALPLVVRHGARLVAQLEVPEARRLFSPLGGALARRLLPGAFTLRVAEPALAERLRRERRHGNVQVVADPASEVELWVSVIEGAARTTSPTILPLRRRSFRRWRELARSPYSVLRSLEYERLRGLRIAGRILDLGGGQHNSYYGLLDVRGRIDSINLSPSMRPAIVADLNGPLPIRDGCYDAVISLNTFEHLTCDELAVAEALRILRPGGEFHFIVPFLYPVHASPSDYHRHTAQWWLDYMARRGVSSAELTIEPLVWDRFSSAYSLLMQGPLGRPVKALAMLPAVLADLRWRGRERLPHNRESDRARSVALGYYIYGRVPGPSSVAVTGVTR